MPDTKSKRGGADRKQTATALAAGAVAASAAVAAAGYYFYGSKGAKQNRRIAAEWAAHLKQEVVSQAKKAKHLDQATILSLVDQAVAAYQTVRSIDPDQLDRAAGELKVNWQQLMKESRPSPRLPKPAAKKSRAKSARKKPVRKNAR